MNLACVTDWEAVAEQAHYRPARMARALEVNVRTLQRFFRATFGQSPRQWLKARRFARARTLLRAGRLAVKQVAAQVGFEDSSAFGRAFKSRHRTNPRRFQMRGKSRCGFLAKSSGKGRKNGQIRAKSRGEREAPRGAGQKPRGGP